MLRAQDVLRAPVTVPCASFWPTAPRFGINGLSEWTAGVTGDRGSFPRFRSRVKYKAPVRALGFCDGVSYGRESAPCFTKRREPERLWRQALANELGLDLYRIDLSGMMNKYIGETEKTFPVCLRGPKAAMPCCF